MGKSCELYRHSTVYQTKSGQQSRSSPPGHLTRDHEYYLALALFMPPRLRISRLTAMLKSIDPVAVMNQAASCFLLVLLAFPVPYAVQPL